MIKKVINDNDNDNNKVSKTDDFVDIENKNVRMLQGCRVTYVLRYRVQNLPIVQTWKISNISRKKMSLYFS